MIYQKLFSLAEGLSRNSSMSAVRRLMVLLVLILSFGAGSMWAQNNYVLYNTTYGYLYNNDGTLNASANLRPGSVWTASDVLTNSNRTIRSAINTSLYIYTSKNNNGTVSLSANSSNWQIRNNYLCTRGNGNNYYLKATSATEFVTSNANSGDRFVAYEVTTTDHAAVAQSGPTISGQLVITSTGSYTYNHATAVTGSPAYANYRFNEVNHFYGPDGTYYSTEPAASVNYTNYSWSINSNSYATINASTGELTVNSMPATSTELTITCTASRSGYSSIVATYNVYLSASGNVSITGMYVITNGTYYLGGVAGQAINNTLAFTPTSCLWTVTNNIWKNSAGGYLYNVNPPSIETGNNHQWTLGDSENGNTGRSLRRNATNGTTYYLRYNNNQWTSTTTTDDRGRVVFAVTKDVYAEQGTAPTINGDNEIAFLGTNNSYSRTDAAYTRNYIDYVFRNNAHHYFEADNTTSINAIPTETFTYTWSLEGISSANATINSSTGAINYIAYVTSDQTATVKLTATSANKTYVVTKSVTFKKPANPTSITITSVSPMNLNMFETGNITYTLAPANCYENVVFASANSNIATVDANGVVTGIAEGQTTITVTAKKLDGTTAATADVVVNVSQGDLYVIYNTSYSRYLGGNSAAGISTFSPSTCLWTNVNGGKWVNSAGYYLGNSPVLPNTAANAATCTLSGTESGTTGRIINSGDNYLRWSNSNSTWQWNNNYNENTVLFAVTKDIYPAQAIAPTISGDEIITALGNNNSFIRSDATCHQAYIDYVFCDGAHHYFQMDNATALTNPSATFSYSWSMTGIPSANATIDASTGVITYSQYVTSDVTATVTLTATSTNPSQTFTATQQVTFKKPGDPTSITITSDNPMTVYVGQTGNITYTLSPNHCYDHVTYTSASNSIATVSNGTVTGIAVGQTTITLTAATLNGGTAPTATVTVNVRDKVATPVIAFNGNGETASTTITCATTGATIHYSVNGGTDHTYTAPFTVNAGDAVTAYATLTSNPNYDQSDVASQTYSVESGITGGEVTLNDLEDHTWTYYSGVDASEDGGNYNTNYLGKIYSPNPRNVKITYRGNGGAVSISEPETTFVYYKTLEKDQTNSNYPYRVISNPFSKRPAGKGFGGWKIISGGEYISGYNNNQTLPLDQDITFINLPYPSVNCISAEIVFEATWVNLNNIVRSTSTGDYTYSTTGGNYETNILVIQRSQTGTITANSPVTIMMVEPDGSADYRTNYTFTGNITPNNTGVTKIEFAKWNSSNTINANFHNLWLGRGMTTTSQTANLLTGTSSTTSTASPQYSLKVESGKLNYLSMIKGYLNDSRTATNDSYTITGDNARIEVTLGNDYDRAAGNNNNLEIVYGSMMGCNGTFSPANRANTHTLNVMVKSGTIGSTYFMENTTNTNYLRGDAGNCMYLSNANKHTFVGRRSVTIEGGDICSVGSGIDYWNNTTGTSTNPTPSTTTNYGYMSFEFRLKGGIIHGNVYGGAAKSPSAGNRRLVVTGGQVKGWLAAGCNGTDNDGGQNYGTSYVYIGGKGRIDSENNTKTLGYANGGNVYAAGAGKTGSTTCGEMTFGSNLVIADESYIERGAYGGGNYGYALASTNIYITGGTNEGKSGTVSGVVTEGGVYGGANQQNGPGVNIWMTGGVMKGGVYGGSNTTGTISESVVMHIDGGQVGTDESHTANIHGGGYGNNTIVTKNIDITLGRAVGQTNPVTVYGDVYGGSALGKTNGTAANTNYHTNVTLNAGTINGSLYGGALGSSTVAANVYGPVAVNVYGGTVNSTSVDGSGGVYGANNVNGAPQRSVTVDIWGTDPATSGSYALDAVYGGGNHANYTYGNGYPKVTVHNCNNSIGYVYGGGNAAAVAATDVTIYGGNVIGNVFGGGNGTVTAANVNGNATTKIYGGTILNVYGGSNSQGTISGTISVTADETTESGHSACPINVTNLYGGGNRAASAAGNITVGCANHIGSVYGGANQANITGNINLNITAGHVDNVFGGNNTSGSISGDVTVTINDDGRSCGMAVGNVYGGGNLAAYSGSPVVNIYNGNVSGNVFGGGLGSTATVGGSPRVTIGDNNNSHTVTIGGDVYGGGDAASVTGSTRVEVNDCSTTIHNVYGGGNAAAVGSTRVTINGGTIDSLYGGGHGYPSRNVGANVNGAVNVAISAGVINSVFGGSNSLGNITGNVQVDIVKDADNACNLDIEYVYGGGNKAAGRAGVLNIGCIGTEKIKEVYGGARNADVNNNIVLNITGGSFEKVFGGNNIGGAVNGTITVNVNQCNECDLNIDNLYGGGNQAAYTAPAATPNYPAVNIIKGTINESAYGGGLGATAVVTGNPQVALESNGIVKHGLFGGGELAPVTGNTTVAVRGGQASMVFGGGRGYLSATNYSASAPTSTIPGQVSGNATVTVSGGNINTTNYSATLGGGNVYGGGLEGKVLGNTNVTVSGGTIAGKVFGGGRGYRYTLAETRNKTITDVASQQAGYVMGNTAVSITGGTIAQGVYGGGSGCIFSSDTTATVMGHAVVDISGGILGGGHSIAYWSTPDCGSYAGGRIASVRGYADMLVHGNADVAAVFGGNDIAGKVCGRGRTTAAHTPSAYSGQYLTTDSTVTYVHIYGTPQVGRAFGGGNGDYNYTSSTWTGLHLSAPAQTESYMFLDLSNGGNVQCAFGGGNNASVTISNVHLTNVGHVDTVFGGGNAATVTNEVNLFVDATVSGSALNASYVFGGNNLATMNILPTVDLNSGRVMNVYGGGNKGAMTGNASRINRFNQTVSGLSTYLKFESANITATGSVYGGCNQADVSHGTFVEVRNTSSNGIANLYGGNDFSGTVNGDARIDVYAGTVGNIFGGSNGSYADANYTTARPRPYCATTHVNIYGGTINANIYAGGLAGDVGSSNLLIDDNTTLHATQGVAANTGVINGRIFGGGRGDDAKALTHGATHVGNVRTTAISDLKHLRSLAPGGNKVAYGGGNAGDVANTILTIYPTWLQPFDTIYGGCRSSDVTGTANTYINITDTTPLRGYASKVVFGGNDFAGTVVNSNLEIAGGRYINIFGAGNGEYDYDNDPVVVSLRGGSTAKAGVTLDLVPVSEVANTTFNGGLVEQCIYGCGNRGFVYKGNKDAIHSSPNDYGRATLNIHGGKIKVKAFAGALGAEGGEQLTYGLKVLNMDGGEIVESVHGGSCNVDDGYPSECHGPKWRRNSGTLTTVASNATTARPSSIVNIMAGRVGYRTYGAGYRGNVYGSTYVNVGKKAIENSKVWTNRYNGVNAAYAAYKPNTDGTGTANDALVINDLELRNSIYAGSDWGENTGTAYFNTPGYFGGESRVLVDGEGYETGQGSSLPDMSLRNSIIGAGTSTIGGDVVSHINLRNYGYAECPDMRRTLKSIQRADTALIENVELLMEGNNDAYQNYATPNYSFNRLDTLIFRGHNNFDIKAAAVYIGELRFENPDGSLVNNRSALASYTVTPSGSETCEDLDFCDWYENNTNNFTKLYIESGYYIDVLPYKDDNGDHQQDSDAPYGNVHGYAYLLSQPGTEAYVSAEYKTPDHNANAGGFFSMCSSQNTQDVTSGVGELTYTNHNDVYRTWSVGSGAMLRARQTTIIANAHPSDMSGIDFEIPNAVHPNFEADSFAYAHSSLLLPPSKVGHYYRVSNLDIDFDGGHQLQLTPAAYNPNTGAWVSTTSSVPANGDQISLDPNLNFGLIAHAGANFTNANSVVTGATKDKVVAGGAYVNNFVGWVTPQINTGENIFPQLDLYLTYKTSFSYTIIRNLTFTLDEFDENGNYVAPILVTVSIQTVKNDISDYSVSMLAMFNDGIADVYGRKVMIPATTKDWTVYLTSVQWEPLEGYQDDFSLTNESNTPNNDPSIFGFHFAPTEDVSSITGSDGAWHNYDENGIDVYTTAGQISGRNVVSLAPTSFVNESNPHGKKIGELDGRFTAAMRVDLLFNGNVVYPRNATVGKVVMEFDFVGKQTNDIEHMVLTSYVRTRKAADTIYLASADKVVRNGITLHPYNYVNGHIQANAPIYTDSGAFNSGKTPARYVQTFERALTSPIYEEGDVICIIDTVFVGGSYGDVSIRGADYSTLQVIRYEGGHFHFPDTNCAYRGPMIKVIGNGNFTVWNMRLDGKGVGRTKASSTFGSGSGWDWTTASQRHNYTLVNGNYYHVNGPRKPNMLFADGPIIWATGKSQVLLADNVTVLNNFNRSKADVKSNNNTDTDHGWKSLLGGAIRIEGTATAKPTVTLQYNVKVEKNLSNRLAKTTNNNSTGAIHVKNGKLQLAPSPDASAVKVTDNYYSAYLSFSTAAATTRGSKPVYHNSNPDSVYRFDATYFSSHASDYLKSNVFLTRVKKVQTGYDPAFNDEVNDVVYFSNDVSYKTRIGINKWFPDGRDTIRFAYAQRNSAGDAQDVYNDGLFTSDSLNAGSTGYQSVFYNQSLNSYNLYFFRCISFHSQLAGDETNSALWGVEDSVYRYLPNMTTGSMGNDTLKFNVAGGFFPRTFNWYSVNNNTETLLQTTTTQYKSREIGANDVDKRKASNTDFFITNDITFTPTENEKTYRYRVKASDLMGCTVTKDIQLKVIRTVNDQVTVDGHTISAPGTFTVKTGNNSIADTLHNHVANAYRVYRGVQLEVFALSSNNGDVAIRVPYADNTYTFNPSTVRNAIFNPNDLIELNAQPNTDKQFLMWDFDPYAGGQTSIAMPSKNTAVTAYFAPEDYWVDVVKTKPAGYVTHYDGSVDIYSEEGLAWLISTVDGFHGQQARPFYFDTVRIHAKTSGSDRNVYKMDAHLWTPVGNTVNNFRGTVKVDDDVEIRGIVLNEPNAGYVGFFGSLNKAAINDMTLTEMIVRGQQYVGGLAAQATDSTVINNCKVTNNGGNVFSVITGTNTCGGLVGHTDGSTITGSTAKIKAVGAAVYNGGIVGTCNNATIDNNNASVQVTPTMSSIYTGGAVAHATGTNNLPGAKSANGTHIANNYVRFVGDTTGLRYGGLVGYADNTVMENNYVYGAAKGSSTSGAIAATLGNQVALTNCFYENGMADNVVAMNADETSSNNITSFSGTGNQVLVEDFVGGVNNLTRILNLWVREQGEDAGYYTWRSAQPGENYGYPVFGTPDLVPVNDTITYTTCDFFTWNGEEYYESGNYSARYTDSLNFVDSTVTLMLTINPSMESWFADSALVGDTYNGYGFTLSATESELLRATVDSLGSAMLQFVDTLRTQHGCDSIVTLNLVLYKNADSEEDTTGNGGGDVSLQIAGPIEVTVYPNPTTDKVTVEASGLQRVEIYDNLSRRISDRAVKEQGSATFNMFGYPSGSYYLRIHTEQGVVIKKLIKK